jgi:hypothetical protein
MLASVPRGEAPPHQLALHLPYFAGPSGRRIWVFGLNMSLSQDSRYSSPRWSPRETIFVVANTHQQTWHRIRTFVETALVSS